MVAMSLVPHAMAAGAAAVTRCGAQRGAAPQLHDSYCGGAPSPPPRASPLLMLGCRRCQLQCRARSLLRLLLLLPALLVPVAPAAAAAASTCTAEHLRRGLSLHDAGRAAEALPHYEAAAAAVAAAGGSDGSGGPGAAAVAAPHAAALEELGRLDEAAIQAAVIGEAERWQLEVALALGWQRRSRVEEAIAAYRRAAAAVPVGGAGRVRLNLGLALRTQGRLEEAIPELQRAAELLPAEAAPRFHSGVALKRLGRAAEAAAAFRSCLAVEPAHAEAAHLLSALGSGPAADPPAAASEGYVRSVFDAAAGGYDDHLVNKLGYRGPEILEAAVATAIGRRVPGAACAQEAAGGWEAGLVLDLGCGTGLCGSWLRGVGHRLVGIDLSAEMLVQAEARGLYDALVAGDVLTALGDGRLVGPGGRVQLIVAADVFVYLGALDGVLAAAAGVLAPCGLVAFTVEDCEADREDAVGAGDNVRYPCTRLMEGSTVPVPSYCSGTEAQRQRAACGRNGLVLQPSGRFAHSWRHVRMAAAAAGLEVVVEEAVSSRREGGRAVPGVVYVLGMK